MRLAFLRTGTMNLGDCHGLDAVVSRGRAHWHSAINFAYELVPSGHTWFTSLPKKGVCWERLGPVTAYDCLDVPITPEQECAVHRWCVTQIGRPYDWRGMLGIGNGDGAYCTEIVVEGVQHIGLFTDLVACKQHADPFYEVAREAFGG